MPAEPAVVWAHLTSPELRTLWEGPLEIVGDVAERDGAASERRPSA